MIKILRGVNNSKYSKDLIDLYACRYRLFVEGRGWSELAREDKLDIEDYDDAGSTYIVCYDDGKIVGGARLRPTVHPHMLDEVFHFLCLDGRPPTGPQIAECSRTFVERRHPRRREIFLEVLAGVARWGVENGYSEMTGVLETWWANSYLAVGLAPIPLGVPQNYHGMSLMAVKFKVDDNVLRSLEAKLTGLQGALIRRDTHRTPSIKLPPVTVEPAILAHRAV